MRRRVERGYTLIEIMTVITILGILMSIMIYGLTTYRRRAYYQGSLAVITNVKAGLDGYYSTYRTYPPDGFDAPVMRQVGGTQKAIKGSQCLIYFLGFPTAQEVEVGQDLRVVEHKPFMELKAEMLSGAGELEDRLADGATEIIDKFGNPIHYDNVAPDPNGNITAAEQSDRHIEDGAMVTAPDPRKRGGTGSSTGPGGSLAKNKGSYDIWSHGYKIADISDDITNWSQ